MTMKLLNTVALVLVIVGALNWGLVAVNKKYDAVKMLLGKKDDKCDEQDPKAVRVVYALVGVAALVVLYSSFVAKEKPASVSMWSNYKN